MYLKSKINLFLPVAFTDTVRDLITVQGVNVSNIRPVFKNLKLSLARILNYLKQTYYFLNTVEEGVFISIFNHI